MPFGAELLRRLPPQGIALEIASGTGEHVVHYAAARPDRVHFTSAAIGSGGHLAGELFKQSAKFFAVHIPYRGAAPALQDVLAGQADFVMDPGIAFPHVRAGKARMLAVAGAKRSAFFPEVPTLSELGMKGAELDIWFGLWSPNGTPADINALLASEAKQLSSLIRDKNISAE